MTDVRRTSLAVLLLFAWTTHVFAQMQGSPVLGGEALVFWVGHTESDNLGRMTEGERGAFENLGVAVDFARDSARIDIGAEGAVEHRIYVDDVYEDDSVGYLEAFGNVAFIPRRFTWDTSGNFGNVRTNATQAIGPENRETYTALSTGPVISLPVGQRTSVQFSSTYRQNRYKISDFYDSESVVYEVGLTRDLTRVIRVGMVARQTDYRPSDDLALGYEIELLQFTYRRQLASGNVLVDIGENRTNLGGDSYSGEIISLAWSRNLTARSQLTLEAGREQLGAGELFGLANYSLIADPQSLLLTTSPLEQDRAGFQYIVNLAQMNVTARAVKFSQSYSVDSIYDNDSTEIALSVNRAISQRLDLGVHYYFVDRNYEVGGNDGARDQLAQIWLDRRVGARFSLQFFLERYKRDSTQAIEDNLYGVRLLYIPGIQGNL